MDNTKIRSYQIVSAIFVSIVGTLLHFTYKFFGENSFGDLCMRIIETSVKKYEGVTI